METFVRKCSYNLNGILLQPSGGTKVIIWNTQTTTNNSKLYAGVQIEPLSIWVDPKTALDPYQLKNCPSRPEMSKIIPILGQHYKLEFKGA